MSMSQKIVQYLNEAHATEMGLVRVLQSQIAMTPRGSYRRALEKHLTETRSHADRVEKRLAELGAGGNPIQATVGLVESVLGQVLALSKTPIDLLRGTGGEEKVLKNAKDTCATEALEIATYLALEELAKRVNDDETVKLAREIRREEERMLAKVQGELPALVDAVARAELAGDPSYDPTKTGAADSVRRRTRGAAKRAGAAEPWRGYDKATVEDIRKRLERADDNLARTVRRYERAHKDRAGVIEATDRELAQT
jgi:ferritin-like metal-binding protein YciE